MIEGQEFLSNLIAEMKRGLSKTSTGVCYYAYDAQRKNKARKLLNEFLLLKEERNRLIQEKAKWIKVANKASAEHKSLKEENGALKHKAKIDQVFSRNDKKRVDYQRNGFKKRKFTLWMPIICIAELKKQAKDRNVTISSIINYLMFRFLFPDKEKDCNLDKENLT